jgi:hypothetical protein
MLCARLCHAVLAQLSLGSIDPPMTELVKRSDVQPFHAFALFPEVIREAPIEAQQECPHSLLSKLDRFLTSQQCLSGPGTPADHHAPLPAKHIQYDALLPSELDSPRFLAPDPGGKKCTRDACPSKH